MQEAVRHPSVDAKPLASLASAMRLARVEAAERSQAVAELRSAEMARLEVLQESIAPLLAQVPDGVDLFDSALVPGDHPRLFLDMIGFIEMGRDRRLYRFVQDTRHGRVVMAESERIEPMVEAARHYIARRLVERERALASDQTIEQAARAYAAAPASAPPTKSGQEAAPASPIAATRKTGFRFVHLARFLIEFLGAFTLGMLILGAIFFAYAPVRAWLSVRFGLPPG